MTTPKPPVDPVVWRPPPDPGLTGDYERNERLAAADRIPLPGEGPEDVVVADDGTVYTATRDGAVHAITDDGRTVRRVTQTADRGMGIELLPDGRLLLCNAGAGLLAIDPSSGEIEPLVTSIDGAPPMLVNNATVGPDGTIWFSQSSRTHTMDHYKGEIIAQRATGRVFRRDPDGTVTQVMDDLCFANGVALEPGGESLLVAETGRFRTHRLWLEGARAGTSEVFAEQPGFPDNISIGPTGTIWCALASSRVPMMDFLVAHHPILRKLAWALPDALQPGAKPEALVIGYDAAGNVTHNLQTHAGDFVVATGAREHDGHLYVSSLEADHLLRLAL